jgi:hypothetical protein
MTPPGFTIQLYDPDQQVSVTYKESSILGSAKWDFGLPQDTFRTPSASMIDKSLNDPGAAATTPKITFSWKKEKLGKELVCFYTGKSTDGLIKRKHKEPDVTCAILKSLKQLTVYESNLSRIDLEDPKGFEVVLLLSAAVIRDVYFGNLRHTFNIAEVPRRTSTTQSTTSKPSTSSTPPVPVNHPLRVNMQPAAAAGLYAASSSPQTSPAPQTRTPQHDARTQWEIDQETARLRTLAEAEARAIRDQEAKRRQERERAADEETRRLRKIVQEEEKQRRRREREIEEETERLRRQYGVQEQGQPSQQPPRPTYPPQQQQQMPGAWPSPQQGYGFRSASQHQGHSAPQSGYYNAPAPPERYAGSSWDGSSGGGGADPAAGRGSSGNEQGRKPSGGKPRKSFWDLRGEGKLTKKSSSVW